MRRHKQFVKSQVQTHFAQQEKKPYPFFRIALATFLQVPEETLANLPVISGVGRHRLRIENCLSIQTYQEEQIVLLCTEMMIVIIGKKLQIVCLNEDEVVIEGEIERLEYR